MMEKRIKKEDCLVCVRCMTYNQSQYIKDAMDGFCMQHTDFPFVCAILDDSSTDGEQEIIRNYLQDYFDLEDKSIVRNEETDDYILTYARHKTNYNCFFVVLYLKHNHYKDLNLKERKLQYIAEWETHAKYIALCEGDDYWTDPYKLQKQVDVMEAHPECSICFARVAMVDRNGNKTPWLIPEKGIINEGICTLDDFARLQFGKGRWVFHTSSFFYKKTVLDGYQKALNSGFGRFPYGDLPMILFSLTVGDGYYVDELISCYRLMSGGYNSMRLKNPEMDIKHGEMIIAALNDFNLYTDYRYDKYIKKAILRNECGIDRVRNKLYYLNIKYLPLLSFRKVLLIVLKPIKKMFPSVYSCMKRVYWKCK